jgi:hypothetical protein
MREDTIMVTMWWANDPKATDWLLKCLAHLGFNSEIRVHSPNNSYVKDDEETRYLCLVKDPALQPWDVSNGYGTGNTLAQAVANSAYGFGYRRGWSKENPATTEFLEQYGGPKTDYYVIRNY